MKSVAEDQSTPEGGAEDKRARLWDATFDIPFEGRIGIVATDRVLEFTIIVYPDEGEQGISPQTPASGHGFILPRAFIQDQSPDAFFHIVAANFDKTIKDAMTAEAMLLFTDLVNFTLLHLNPAGATASRRQRIIANHLKRTEARLREFFKVKPQTRGHFSPWDVTELSTAVTEAARGVRGRVTAEKIARRLQKSHGEKAPPSGKALLQLMRRHGLKWAQVVEQASTRQR